MHRFAGIGCAVCRFSNPRPLRIRPLLGNPAYQQLLAFSTVTTWDVYPVGYVLSISAINMNWVHISFSVADVVSKAGLSVAVYLVGKSLLDEWGPQTLPNSPTTSDRN